MKIKILHVTVILALLVAAGFLRENIFNAVNYQIKALQNDYDLWNFTGGYSFLNGKTLSYYMNVKWVFTMFFFLLHWAVALYMVWTLFYDKWNFRLVHITWICVFVLSGFVYAVFGWLISENTTQTKGYEFARTVMGAGQSPVLVMLIAAVCRVRWRMNI